MNFEAQCHWHKASKLWICVHKSNACFTTRKTCEAVLLNSVPLPFTFMRSLADKKHKINTPKLKMLLLIIRPEINCRKKILKRK